MRCGRRAPRRGDIGPQCERVSIEKGDHHSRCEAAAPCWSARAIRSRSACVRGGQPKRRGGAAPESILPIVTAAEDE
jgi:hypothetical protein